jgi:hypothetical protein
VTNGGASVTTAALQPTFLYAFATVAAFSAGGNILNVLTILHNEPRYGPMGPIVLEASSWTTLVLFCWIPWIGFRLNPLFVRPRWRLLLHLPIGFAYSFCHVGGFVLLRKIVYRLQGTYYDFGPFWPKFLYEFRKDAVAYALFIVGFSFVARLMGERRQAAAQAVPATFDIRDGAKLYRVLIEDILAVLSAGNYVEFLLRDGRKPSMRSSLSALESKLRPYGFVRTHRSWLVNPGHMTALRPQGSGDYMVDLGALSVPLSRRFPAALAKLRGKC